MRAQLARMTVLLLGGLLTACAAMHAEPPDVEARLSNMGYRVGEEVRRVDGYRLDSWQYVDDQHLVMRAGAGRSYLVTLKAPCFELRSSTIAVHTTTMSQLTRNDVFLLNRPGGPAERCFVDSLHELEKSD